MRLISLHGKAREFVVKIILDHNITIELLTYLDEENIERALRKPIANYFNPGSNLVCFQTTSLHYISWDKIRFVRLAQ